MTSGALLRILARRWYVLVVALIVAGFAFVLMNRTGGAFVAETQVMFIAPGTDAIGTVDDGYRDTLVNFAATIEREFHDGKQADRLAEHASLFGSGVSDGYQVVLPNNGGQWENSFATPALSVSVTGPTAAEVSATMTTLLDRIDTLSYDRQIASNVAPENMILTERLPTDAAISYVGSSRSTQARAAVMLVAVCLGIAAAMAVAIDRRSSQRGSPAPISSSSFTPQSRKVRVQ